MITAFIVLLVIALGGGAYIAFTEIRGKSKKAASSPNETVSENADIRSAEQPTEVPAPEPENEADEIVVGYKTVAEDGKKRLVAVRYSKSFLAKLIQSDEQSKKYYSEIKNRLLAYSGVKSRMSWRWESFVSGRNTLARLRLRGKTLALFLALDADEARKYKAESLDGVKAYEKTPCMYRKKSARRLGHEAELIAELMQNNGIAEAPSEAVDYAEKYAYETTEALIERKLIKELAQKAEHSDIKFKPLDIRESVTVQEADALMQDETAAGLLERAGGTSDRTKTGIVNIDTLSQYFESGEVVTLDGIKDRVKGFNRQITCIKVLGRA